MARTANKKSANGRGAATVGNEAQLWQVAGGSMPSKPSARGHRGERHGGTPRAIRMKLTPTQRKAVEHSGTNLQLIACAGSGKTEAVARRVVHLLTPGRADSLVPRNIIAFTSTDEAAAELKERIVTRTRQALGDIPGMAEMFVGTIHASCLELLKSESPKHLRFELLNEAQQGLFVIADVKTKVRDAAEALRTATLPTAPAPNKCASCDYRGMCTAGRAASAS